MNRLLNLWRARPWLTSAFILACAMTLFFAGTFTYHTIYWANHRDQPIEPWMTVGYVARSWDLNGREIDAQAGLPTPDVKGRPQPLSEIAADRGIPVSDVIAEVEAAIKVLREEEAARHRGNDGGDGEVTTND
jgi:hypothetical protein